MRISYEFFPVLYEFAKKQNSLDFIGQDIVFSPYPRKTMSEFANESLLRSGKILAFVWDKNRNEHINKGHVSISLQHIIALGETILGENNIPKIPQKECFSVPDYYLINENYFLCNHLWIEVFNENEVSFIEVNGKLVEIITPLRSLFLDRILQRYENDTIRILDKLK